jgi:uncharacterized DUF497 family protein
MRFEWDEGKRLANIKKHNLDFENAALVFADIHYTGYSPRPGEDRWLTVGKIKNDIVTVVWTKRGDKIRIISVRKARDEEKRRYSDLLVGRDPGQGSSG